MSSWNFIDTGIARSEWNMEYDRNLLHSLSPQSLPTLHVYDWKNSSATYGYFLNPLDWLDLMALDVHAIDLARRPTGGGILFHFFDCTFSFLIPKSHPIYVKNILESYKYINQIVQETLVQFLNGCNDLSLLTKVAEPLHSDCTHFCMAHPVRYDLMLAGKKVGGGAQRRTKTGLLHQGFITLFKPPLGFVQNLINPQKKALDALENHGGSLFEGVATPVQMRKHCAHFHSLLSLMVQHH